MSDCLDVCFAFELKLQWRRHDDDDDDEPAFVAAVLHAHVHMLHVDAKCCTLFHVAYNVHILTFLPLPVVNTQYFLQYVHSGLHCTISLPSVVV